MTRIIPNITASPTLIRARLATESTICRSVSPASSKRSAPFSTRGMRGRHHSNDGRALRKSASPFFPQLRRRPPKAAPAAARLFSFVLRSSAAAVSSARFDDELLVLVGILEKVANRRGVGRRLLREGLRNHESAVLYAGGMNVHPAMMRRRLHR